MRFPLEASWHDNDEIELNKPRKMWCMSAPRFNWGLLFMNNNVIIYMINTILLNICLYANNINVQMY